ncbi:MAG: flagellar type III secretion system pore protein FliP [candidate division FCPU426 bacterium]
MRHAVFAGVLALLLLSAPAARAQATFQLSFGQSGGTTALSLNASEPDRKDLSGLLQILILMTAITLAPALLVLCTSFTRILIVLSFLRQALGTQHIPPNQILVALALFLTACNMMPVWQSIENGVVKPYQAGQISWQQVIEQGPQPLKEFMLKQTRPKDLALFLKMARQPRPQRPQDVSFFILVPAFIVGELKVAFQIGFLLYLPFLVVDMVVASILLSMGMMMLPPVMVSLPFKLLLFVLVDGWNLLLGSLLRSFQ